MKKVLLFAVAAATIFTSCNSGGGAKNVAIETQMDSISSAVGVLLGAQIKELEANLEISKVNIDIVYNEVLKMQGLDLKDEDAIANIKAAEAYVSNYANVVLPKMRAEKAEKFLAEQEKMPNVIKTESGLLYEIIEEGDMANKPTADDTVVVHYKGTKLDGSTFDSSYDRGETAEFKLSAVIKGWTEGLQYVGKGGKIRLVIPKELAYGDNMRHPLGGQTLQFDVELIDVKPNAEAK